MSRDAAKAPSTFLKPLRGQRVDSPVREGVPGQVQVGEVGAAASQQGPKQLAETESRSCCVIEVANRLFWLSDAPQTVILKALVLLTLLASMLTRS